MFASCGFPAGFQRALRGLQWATLGVIRLDFSDSLPLNEMLTSLNHFPFPSLSARESHEDVRRKRLHLDHHGSFDSVEFFVILTSIPFETEDKFAVMLITERNLDHGKPNLADT